MKIEIEKSPRRERYAYGRRSIVSPLSPHAGIQSVIECDYDPQGWIFWKIDRNSDEDEFGILFGLLSGIMIW